MKTAFTLFKDQLELNNQLFELGLISHVEKITADQTAKYLYVTQKRDEQ
jgi:hypothetical protein